VETIQTAYLFFDKHKPNHPLVVADDGIPMGIIDFNRMKDQIKGELSQTAYLSQNLIALLLKEPLTVDADWPLLEVWSQYLRRIGEDLFDPIIVTSNQKIAGLIPSYKLIKQMTELKEIEL